MIIPSENTLVNPRKFDVWAEKKQLNTMMSDKMRRARMDMRAERMSQCADQIEITLCPKCGRYEISKAILCHDRLCPVCSWRLSLKRFAQMMQIVRALLDDHPTAPWSFMTLTVRNCAPDQLHYTLRRMAEAYNRMRQRKAFKGKIAGFARTVEVTYNASSNELHPHYHILIMWDDAADPLSDGARLLNAWIASCRDGLIASYKGQHIEDVDGSGVDDLSHDDLLRQSTAEDLTRSVLETFKYTQKATDILKMPIPTFRAFADNMQGIRALSFGGLIKAYAARLGINEDEEATSIDAPFSVCPYCRNPNLVDAVYKWAMSEHSYLRIDPTTSAVVGDPVKSVNKRQKRQRRRTN